MPVEPDYVRESPLAVAVRLMCERFHTLRSDYLALAHDDPVVASELYATALVAAEVRTAHERLRTLRSDYLALVRDDPVAATECYDAALVAAADLDAAKRALRQACPACRAQDTAPAGWPGCVAHQDLLSQY